ncbi:MAG TPA: 2-hydroxychromene-2-carboxylate isomerase [Solirubrobacteraceae bacterium]|nr:2-hydroxychromene-2-carboxylate isomerase [Solirubrobacteraceae bacterium]
MPHATFYFDLGSPYAYLAAERLDSVLGGPVDWQPILLGGIFRLSGRSSWSLRDRARREHGIAEIERRAREYGLPALRWPQEWPSDYLFAMRAATVAFAAGRGREFAVRAFRDAFQRGRDLGVVAHVLGAARQAGLDPDELLAAAQRPRVKQQLREATDAAYALGVIGVPTLAVSVPGRGCELFWGEDRLEDAAARLASGGAPSGTP